MFDTTTITYLQKFKKLALAVSGGIDSMCLLSAYEQHKNILPEFVVVNVHHNLRGDEGRSDSEFVRAYCQSKGITCLFFDEDIPSFCNKGGYGVEQGARIRRREIFKQLTTDKIAERVLTAHHLGDQTESVLMHIFRGTGINGLCGMAFDDGVLIRPLLSVSKSQIQYFASANAIDYVTDSTNTQTDYSRNKIRLDIIPQLTSVYGNIDGNIARLTAVATQIKTFVNKHCPTPIKEGDCVKVKTEWLLERDFISAELVARAVESLTTRVDLTKEHIDMVYDLATATNAQKINLPFGVVAYKEYDFISFTLAKNSNESITFAQFGQGQFDCGSWIVNISTTDNGGLVCDLNTLKDCVLRTRATGDTFKKFGGGTKSLGDFFTDKKTPLRQRPSIVLLAKGSTIMAALPYEISDLAKTTPATTQKVFVKAEQKNL